MGILNLIARKKSQMREQKEYHKAMAVGIDPKKYQEYKQEREKAQFLTEIQTERETEEKIIKMKGEQKLQAEMERVKQGSGVKAVIIGAAKGYKQYRKSHGLAKKAPEIGLGGPGPQFGLDKKKENPFDIRVKR